LILRAIYTVIHVSCGQLNLEGRSAGCDLEANPDRFKRNLRTSSVGQFQPFAVIGAWSFERPFSFGKRR
jgi:hypothetical protein